MIESFRDQLPDFVRMRAESAGDAGLQWLENLDDLTLSLQAAWQFEPREILSGGTESLVLKVRCPDDRPAIVKIGYPGTSNLALEAGIYQQAQGRGYARLLQLDADRNAMMMEQLETTLAASERSVEEQLDILCEVLTTAWQVAPDTLTASLMTGAAKADWLTDFILDKSATLEHGLEDRVFTRALEYISNRRRQHAGSAQVLCHGDAHALNCLQSADGDYRFIDPEGLLAERASDLGVIFREWPEAMLAGDPLKEAEKRLARLSNLTGVDETAIWEWGFTEAVSSSLAMLDIGMVTEAQGLLALSGKISVA